MGGTVKFIFSIVAAALLVFGAALVALTGTGYLPASGSGFVWVGAWSAALVVVVASIARLFRRASAAQTASLLIPVLLFAVTTLLCFGGDAQEHLVRDFLHRVQRVLPQDWVSWSITGVLLIVPLLSACLLWIALSLLSSFDLKVPLILCGSSWGLVVAGLALSSLLFLVKKAVIVGVTLGVLALVVTTLLAVVARQLHFLQRLTPAPGILGGTLILFALALGAPVLRSSPEVRLPESPVPKTMDVAMANSVMQGAKPWACFPLLTDLAWSWSAASLPNTTSNTCGEKVPTRPSRFKAEPSHPAGTNIWLEDGAQRRLVKHYQCGGIRLDEISADRNVVTGCTQLEVFDAQGNQMSFFDFVRPEVRFASVSEDHNRFAAIVYLVGFGDPPHLEEETVVVFNAADGRPVLAAKLNPIPDARAWGALSPEGSRLAVAADNSLRLFQLPVAKDQAGR